MSDYGANYLTKEETIEGTWGPNGDDFPLEVKDMSKSEFELVQKYGEVSNQALTTDPEEVTEEEIEEVKREAEELDDLPWGDEVDSDSWLQQTIEAKLVRPDVDLEDARVHKLRELMEGMMQAWQEGNQ